MQSKWVQMGSVRRFDDLKPDKAQALKPLEKAIGEQMKRRALAERGE